MKHYNIVLVNGLPVLLTRDYKFAVKRARKERKKPTTWGAIIVGMPVSIHDKHVGL